MKKGKKVIIVIISVLIVLTSLVAYVSSAARISVLNPSFYSKYMPALNGYNGMYDGFVDYLLEPFEKMDVPPELQGVPEDIINTAIPKDEFNQLMGEAIGGGMGWLLYNHDDVEIPLKYMVEQLSTTIAEDERVIASETNIQEVMDAIVFKNLGFYVPRDGNEQTFRGFMHYFLSAGRQEYIDRYNFYVDELAYYYGVRLTIITIASVVILLLLIGILILVTKGNRQIPIKLVQVLCIGYAIINGLCALVLFFPNVIMNLSSSLASKAKYVEYIRSSTNSFGVLAIFFALVLVCIAIGLNIIKNKVIKNAD